MEEHYDANEMPLSSNEELKIAQEKILNNIPLTTREKFISGADHPVTNIDGYELKSNCVYRVINEELYSIYCETGFVYGVGIDDEYEEYIKNGILMNNNRGVDWYLGGACLKYGNVIIECPASKEYFVPTKDNGCGRSYDPKVRQMKSSGYKNPVPMHMVRLIKHPHIKVDIHKLNNSYKTK